MNDLDVIATVKEINEWIFDKTGYEYLCVTYETRGNTNAVTFLGQQLWNDEDDMRAYLDAGFTQEPLYMYLKREIHNEIRNLMKLLPDNESYVRQGLR